MFGLGFGELLIIGILALILIGPKQLPEFMKGVARMMKSFDEARTELRQAVESDETLKQIREDVEQVKDRFHSEAQQLEKAINERIHEVSEDTEILDPKDLPTEKEKQEKESKS